jgi:hypothetical protein
MNVRVPEPKNADPEFPEQLVSLDVGCRLFRHRVSAAVQLYDELCLSAIEVGDPTPDRMLTPEVGAIQLAGSNPTPDPRFHHGRSTPELAGSSDENSFHDPSPQPSPRRGEGVLKSCPLIDSPARRTLLAP